MYKRVCRICKEERDLSDFNKGWLGGYSPNCRGCDKERGKEYYNRIKKFSEKRIEKAYGITKKDYDFMYETQEGKCQICGEKHKTLCIDHDHNTGKVRGLLCNHCNWAIGHFRDDVERIENAKNYLEKHSK